MLQRADNAGEVVITALVQAALERDKDRLQLRHIANHLLAAEQDRRSSADPRAAAASERQHARTDREATPTALREAVATVRATNSAA